MNALADGSCREDTRSGADDLAVDYRYYEKQHFASGGRKAKTLSTCNCVHLVVLSDYRHDTKVA